MKLKLFIFAALAFIIAACSSQQPTEDLPATEKSIKTVSAGSVASFKEEHKGKVLLVNFFASWCPPCRAETPDFVKVYEREKDRFAIVALSTEKSKKDIAKYMSEFNVSYPVYKATDDLSMEFGIRTIPTTIIYGPDGKLIDIIVGAISEKELMSLINKLVPR